MYLDKVYQGLLSLLFPLECAACGGALIDNEKLICLHCISKIPFTHFNHLHQNPAFKKFEGRVPIAHACSLTYYTKGGVMQALLHQLKYKSNKEIGYFLGVLFAQEFCNLDWVKHNTIDVIIPLPLHPKKEKQRGYNQSEILATSIAKQLHIPIIHRCIIREHNNESQTHKTRLQRIENVNDVFKVVNTESIIGKNILIIDDVLTTGATLEACAKELLPYSKSVSIATLCIAED